MLKGNVIVSGGFGFIGSHLVEKLLRNNYKVTVIDNLSNPSKVISNPNLTFIESDILDFKYLQKELTKVYTAIIHLAAKVGVRQSIKDSCGYHSVNVRGTHNLFELAIDKHIPKFIFASSSSVYGVNYNIPFKEIEPDLKPISPYGETKLFGEFLGRSFSELYNIQFLALRFFSVYGERQRPDLAIHDFSKKILAGETINIYGDGNSKRDYTHVSDIVQGIFNCLKYNKTDFEVFNLGNGKTISLKELIATLEEVFEKKAIINYLPEQNGDAPLTYADISKAKELLNYNPKMNFKEGIVLFKKWLLQHDKTIRKLSATK